MKIPRRSDLEDLSHADLVTLAQECVSELARRSTRLDEAKASEGREQDALRARARGHDRDPHGW